MSEDHAVDKEEVDPLKMPEGGLPIWDLVKADYTQRYCVETRGRISGVMAGLRPLDELILQDMTLRDELGEKKYGTRLHAKDGRSSLWEGYQELMDALVYLRKALFNYRTKPECVQNGNFIEQMIYDKYIDLIDDEYMTIMLQLSALRLTINEFTKLGIIDDSKA